MRTKKFIFQLLGLAFSLSLLAGCGSPAAPTTPSASPVPSVSALVDFSGHWEDPASAFILDLSQSADQVQGKHEVVAQGGNKIDALDNSIKGNVQADKATVTFQSSFAAATGTAQITFIDANTIFWKIITPPSGEFYLPAQATLMKKAAPVGSNPVPAATSAMATGGTITGSVYLAAPPTPHMVVYAVDSTSGTWVYVETQPTDGEASFSLNVPPGTYQVFGAVDGAGSTSVGYSIDSLALDPITVVAGQTVSGINVRPPSQSDCGSMMGYPASPDGRFAAMPGPDANCLAATQNPVLPSQTVRIQFQQNATSWQTPGDLAPGTSIRFVLNVQQGQIMDVELTVPDMGGNPPATISIAGADGQLLSVGVATRWKGAVPTSQDYYIDVRSLSQQTVNYSLLVAIPAIGSTPYVPVPATICQTIQDLATQSSALTFSMQPSVTFNVPLSTETGYACVLTATSTGAQITDPIALMSNLKNGFLGWTEYPNYNANGATGESIAMTRDSALMLIYVGWRPSPDANCPANQPISSCVLTPEQRLYTITIQTAMR